MSDPMSSVNKPVSLTGGAGRGPSGPGKVVPCLSMSKV